VASEIDIVGLAGRRIAAAAAAAVHTSAVTEFAGFPVATVEATAGSAREPAGNLEAIGSASLVAMQAVV
jgi:hypothetical protein